MRVARSHIVNFRCLRDFQTSLEDVTILVGANGTGKSTLLQALRWFFEGGDLEAEDHAGHQSDRPITVGVTFADFNSADREALGSYVVGEEATFWRTWSTGEGEKLTGKGRAFPPFNDVRKHEKASPKRDAYRALRDNRPELGLPTASSAAQVNEALDAWEAEHPELLEESRVDATHLFGFTGGSRLNGRFDFVLVPAVSDPEAETRDARGTLLRQLLDRALGEQSHMREKLSELEEQISVDMREIVVAEGGQALEDLAAAVTADLGRLVPGGQVLLETGPPAFRVPDLSVDVRVADGELQTDVGHQGHGFQRALLIAVVQRLAALRPAPPESETADGRDAALVAPPGLLLALEEPELYQHPLQARHFASTLAALASDAGSSAQVAYATHSEHFVDPGHYQRLRRFQRRSGRAWPEAEVKRATVARVADRLLGAYNAEEVAVRVRMTLRRQVAEAVFAKAVIVVEGDSDVGLLHGVADREGGLDGLGVAVVEGHGKRQLLIPWAIITELGVPAYVVFDADGGLAARRKSQGWDEARAREAQEKEQAENLVVQRTLGVTEEAAPQTHVTETYTVFADTLENECAAWDGFEEAVQAAREELGDWRDKSHDAYRQAAATISTEPPAVFGGLIAQVREMAA